MCTLLFFVSVFGFNAFNTLFFLSQQLRKTVGFPNNSDKVSKSVFEYQKMSVKKLGNGIINDLNDVQTTLTYIDTIEIDQDTRCKV